MYCPVCDGVRMREVEKDGVMIDICPSCKGVWLDRGELDKIIAGVREIRQPFNEWYETKRYDRGDEYDKDRAKYGTYKKKKKRNVFELFEDLFD